MKTLAIITLAAVLALPGLSLAESGATLQQIRSVDGMQPLPIQGMTMVESGGQVFFMSRNGRYVIKGDLHDMWAGGERIPDIATLAATSSKINLDKIGIKMEDLFTLAYGSGPEEVTIFVSPGCPHCKNTLQDVTKGDLGEKYTFNIVPLPFMGQQSQVAVKKLVAAYETDPTSALQALMTDNYSALQATEGGDLEGVKRAMLTAKILGINQVPVLLSSAGDMSIGSPKNLAAWLEGVN